MFFNEDILFRNGALALVWKAGTDSFANKKGRKRKDVIAVLQSNISTLCGTLRNLFPKMGTADGIPLKKMAILAKGIGAIYLMKMDELAKEVTLTCIQLKKPIKLAFDVSKTDGKAKALKGVDLNEDIDAADIPGEAGQAALLLFGFDVDDYMNFACPSPRGHAAYISSPRRSIDGDDMERMNVIHTPPPERDSARKRKRGENEDDVLRRLGEADVNPRAHCLLDEEPMLIPQEAQPEQDLDLDFGDGLALLHGGPGGDVMPEPAPVEEEPRRTTCYDDDQSAMGPPSNLELDSRANVQETPAGAGTLPENTRRRRNEGQAEQDVTVMELPDLENGVPRRGKRAKRRLRLQVDEETSFTLKDMLYRVKSLNAETDMGALWAKIEKTRAPAKSEWKLNISRKQPALDFISSAGRPVASRHLNDMKSEILQNLRAQPSSVAEEAQRSGDASTTNVGISVVAGAAGRSVQESLQFERETGNQGPGAEDTTNAGVSAISAAVGDRNDEPIGPTPPLVDAEEQYPAFDDGMGLGAQVPPPPSEFGEVQAAPEEEVFRAPAAPSARRRRKSVGVDDGAVLGRISDGLKTFEALHPPTATTKRDAARGFLQLLKMQANKSVALKQKESFQDIAVEKLKEGA